MPVKCRFLKKKLDCQDWMTRKRGNFPPEEQKWKSSLWKNCHLAKKKKLKPTPKRKKRCFAKTCLVLKWKKSKKEEQYGDKEFQTSLPTHQL